MLPAPPTPYRTCRPRPNPPPAGARTLEALRRSRLRDQDPRPRQDGSRLMSTRPPPRFVPTLTEVVHSGPAPLTPVPGLSHEQLAQRVLQRVDLVLDRRVRE